MTPSRGPLIAFERSNRLASHSSEGADLSLQLEPLGREAAMLKGVPVALGSTAASPVHPALELGTGTRSFSTWRGISTPGA
jgi:hypothetical protein